MKIAAWSTDRTRPSLLPDRYGADVRMMRGLPFSWILWLAPAVVALAAVIGGVAIFQDATKAEDMRSD